MLTKNRATLESNALLAEGRKKQREVAHKVASKYRPANTFYRRTFAVVSAVVIVGGGVLIGLDDWMAGVYDWKSFMFLPFGIWVPYTVWRGRPDV